MFTRKLTFFVGTTFNNQCGKYLRLSTWPLSIGELEQQQAFVTFIEYIQGAIRYFIYT